MTFKQRIAPRLFKLAIGCALPVTAFAWQAAPPPRPVIVVQPAPNAQFQQTVRAQQTRDQLQKNQLEEQLRQGRADTARQPFASDPTRAARLDQASQAQRDSYQARQQDLLDKYQSAVAPPVVHSQTSTPASSRSGG